MPDFETGRGYHWMKQTKAAIDAGTRDTMPHKPKDAHRTLAQASFNDAVERRLTRRNFTMSFVFDKHGKILRGEEEAS